MAISTKGISQVDLSSGIKTKNNLKSKAEENVTDSFSSLINLSSDNFNKDVNNSSDIKDVSETSKAKVSDVKKENIDAGKESNTDVKDSKQINEEQPEKNVKDTVKNAEASSNEASETKTSETPNNVYDLKGFDVEEKLEDLAGELAALINNIIDVLKQKLGIGDEELEEGLSVLDMNFSDLLNDENINSFILNEQGATEVDILIDEQLSTLIDDVVSEVKGLIDDFSEFDLNAETITADVFPESYTGIEAGYDTKAVIEVNEIIVKADELVKENADIISKPTAVDEDSEEVLNISPKNENPQGEIGSIISEYADKIGDGLNLSSVGDGKEKGTRQDQTGDFKQPGETLINNLNNAVNEIITEDVDAGIFNEGVSEADIIRQVVDEIKANVTNDVSTIEMRLNPESLGRVQITVSSKNGVMQAQIVAETEAAKNAIEANIATLRETFNNQDLKVEAVEVTIASYGFFEGQEQNETFENEKNKSGDKNIRINSNGDALDDVAVDDELETEMMKAQGNSVSYSI
ncbi:MAG: flagellar hook-length control protein FliK [Lachnospiraceae bacterium]|nr:flagellar hook-length control protein FliK [Lachnospiraceae bacterium]